MGGDKGEGDLMKFNSSPLTLSLSHKGRGNIFGKNLPLTEIQKH